MFHSHTADLNEAVVAALLKIQLDFQWPMQSPAFRIVDVSERNTSGATLLRAAGSKTVDVMVKTNGAWTHNDALANYRALAELHDVIEGAEILGGETMTALGWAPEPPMVVTKFVESRELRSAVKTVNDPGLLIGPLETVGEMLAAFHERHRATDRETIDIARRDAMAIARRIPNGEKTMERLLARPSVVVSKSYIDITPSNVLCAENGAVLLIDPPTRQEPALIERDLGTFLFELRKQRSAFGRSVPRPSDFLRLKMAFLRGYGIPNPMDSPTRALVSLFEFRRAAGTSRKRWRDRSPESVRYAVEAGKRMSEFLFPRLFAD